MGTDRGHQAPLKTFAGTVKWRTVNYLSNITPQKSRLNGGVWRSLEQKVRNLMNTDVLVWVITGPLYEGDGMTLPQADETHSVPTGYWKVACTESDCAAFIFPQVVELGTKPTDYLTTIDDIEDRSELNLFPAGSIDEADSNKVWAGQNF